MPPRIAFSTFAFPDATLAAAVSLGRRWGYAGLATIPALTCVASSNWPSPSTWSC